MPVENLFEIIEKLDPEQRKLLLEVGRAMLRPIQETLNDQSDLATPSFRNCFRNRLLIHHATTEAKLTKKSFEYAFAKACLADGKTALIIPSQTNPGADVVVDGVPFSLKTEAATDIRPDRINISKLSEARWIQQCQTIEELAHEAATRIPAHLENYNRIVMLRAYNRQNGKVLYELMEIHKSTLLHIQKLTPADFSARSNQGGSTAKVFIDGEEAFSLRLDGSDGKVTIASLRSSFCSKHCAWEIPVFALDSEFDSH